MNEALAIQEPTYLLGRRVKATALGLDLPDGLEPAEWEEVQQYVLRASNASQWWIGDLRFYAARNYGETYDELERLTGFAYQTLADIAFVASRFNISRRRENLSFSHHREVAGLGLKEQEEWLDRAEAEHLSVHDLRGLLKEARSLGRATPNPIAAVAIRLTVDPDREARWRAAADAAGLELDEWAAIILDRAAA